MMDAGNLSTVSPMMLFHSPGESCLYINQECEKYLGYSSDALSQMVLLDFIHQDDQQALRSLIAKEEKTVSARFRNAEGVWITFLWKTRSLEGRDFLLAVLMPENNLSEQWVQDIDGSHQTSLKVTLAIMASIVEAKNPGMRCSILLLDENQTYVAVAAGPSLPKEYNEAVEGLKIGPLVGSCGTAAFWNIPVVVENIYEDPLWEHLRDAARIAGVYSCWSHPITTINGNVLGAMALYNNEPKLPEKYHMDGLEIAAKMVGLAVEREQLESQLGQSAKMEALGILAGGIAHDFNNLLTAILGNTELAMLQQEEGSETSHMLDEIASASVKATELCQQMLTYAGRSHFTKELFDCNAEIRELGGLLKVIISTNARIRYELDKRALGVMGDRGQLRQVVMNLITNAAEAIGDQEGEICIKTAIKYFTAKEINKIHPDWGLREGEFVIIDVSDNGKGMNDVMKGKIFDPFYTTKFTGRGLGLAAVRGIIQGHNGAITLESSEDQGSTFRVLLPFTKLAETENVEDASDDTEVPKVGILVVDDEKQVREVLSQILGNAGYEVLQASNGIDAVEIYKQEKEKIDCVLLDFSMPKMDGLQAFHEIRKIDNNVRVILSSGYGEDQLSSELKGAGFSGIIQKPVRMNVFLKKVAEVLDLPE